MSVLESFRLDGSRALVTGASRGLGRASALALAEAGADVALLARNGERLEAVAEEVRATTGRRAVALPWCDVRDEAALRAAVDSAAAELGGLDVLVNNAGVEREAVLAEVAMEDWRAVLATNLDATFVATQQFADQLPESGGSIVNFASIAALVGVGAQSAYAASKGGVLSLTRALALELAARSVRVNAIVPGYFDTEMPARVTGEPERLGKLLRAVPLGRLGEPAEIGALVVYLASGASRFITGAAIPIDGGYTAR